MAILWVAVKGLVRARWTERIQEEWLRNLLHERPDLDEARLRRTQTLMNRAVRDCLVTGYEDLIDSLALPDPDDRHVLAAAICGGAQTIVTENVRDFPAQELLKYGLEAERPDDFLLGLLDTDPRLFVDAVRAGRDARQSACQPEGASCDLPAPRPRADSFGARTTSRECMRRRTRAPRAGERTG